MMHTYFHLPLFSIPLSKRPFDVVKFSYRDKNIDRIRRLFIKIELGFGLK